MKLLRELAVTPERSVIVVTHDDRIYKYADRISSMSDGRIIELVDSPSQLTTQVVSTGKGS